MLATENIGSAELLAAVESMAPLIERYRQEMESERRLPAPLVEAMAAAGLFRICVPRSLGGFEVNPEVFLAVVESLARLDGSTAWCLFVSGASGLHAAYLPEAAAREIFSSDPNVVTCGVYAAKGRAIPVEDGYRVTGRWPFASNCQNSAWLSANAVVMAGDTPRLLANGMPEARLMLFPAEDCTVLDTWHSTGLRGSGSHDIVLDGVFIPEDRSFPLMTGRSALPGPLYAGPAPRWQGAAAIGVALGVARAAIDAFADLAQSKVPAFQGGSTPIREQPVVQLAVARAELALRSARALLYETVRTLWEKLRAGEALTMEEELLLNVAACHAADSSVEAVELVYRAGGGTSVYSGSALDRCFRDVHAVAQHAAYSPMRYQRAGRVWLGLPPDPPTS